MEEVVVRLARAAGVKLATAESCTGGLVASRITDVPGSSEGCVGGWVCWGRGGGGGVETVEKKLVPERRTFKGMASQAALDLLRKKIQQGAHPFSKTEV